MWVNEQANWEDKAMTKVLQKDVGSKAPRRYQAKFKQRSIAIIAMQLAAAQPLLTFHAPAIAQSCPTSADSREGVDSSVDPSASQPPDEDAAIQPASDSTGTSGDDGGTDGGDQGDGGGVASSPSGTDGSGGDGAGAQAQEAPAASGNSGEVDDGAAYPLLADGGGLSGVRGANGGGPPQYPFMMFMTHMHDPIDASLADKIHVQVDYVSRGGAPLRFSRVYHSNLSVNTARVTVPMGTGWHNFYDRSVQVLSGSQVRLHRANGRTLDFGWNGSAWTSTSPAGVLTSGSGGWQYINHRDDIENYDSNGRLLSMSQAGLTINLVYDASQRLTNAVNPFGRGIAFAYDAAGRVATVTLPDATTLGYAYDARNNLTSVRFGDGSIRQYLYENGSFTNALTGVIDESGRRRLTWGYDAQGRPSQGYYGSGTNGVSVTYSGNQVTTTDARGTQRIRTFGQVGNRTVLTAIQTAATADSSATAWSFGYDGNGNVLSATTRSGEVQQYSPDTRGRLTNLTRGAGTAQAFAVQATWHPLFRKPTQTIAAGVTRNYTIDGVGRVTQIAQTTSAGTLTVLSRVYNAQGLLQSVTNARGATTGFTYDSLGNRTSITDPLGQTTYISNFNSHGQAGRIQRSDGVVITRAFDGRGRVTARTEGGQTTSVAYDAAGRVTTVTAPDASWSTISYDSAGLPTGGTNHRAETITLSRDAGAKVVNQSIYSSTGSLAFVSTNRFDAVGRLAALQDSRGYSTQLKYAVDGRFSGHVDPLNLAYSVQLDVLSRKTALIQPNTAAMRQITGNATATTNLQYDGRGNQIGVTDVRAVPTTYGYDAGNRNSAENGSDIGGLSYARNAAGDITSRTDARGITLNRSFDALGRTTAITPPSGAARSYIYVPGRPDSLLSQMTDPSGTALWTYDANGRTLTKRQTEVASEIGTRR